MRLTSVDFRLRVCAKNPLKTFVFQQWQYIFEPDFQIAYNGIQATDPANFIEATDAVQRIQQFKL